MGFFPPFFCFFVGRPPSCHVRLSSFVFDDWLLGVTWYTVVRVIQQQELGKLISYSGTPTVVWRRTGEICLVAPEFCMLTEWPMEELVGRKKYIYELFENQSVVEYWENFASHAFENTTRSVYSHCVLLKPNGAPVSATFCFSIRRDLFDLPSMVIGQWLPLL